MEVFKAVATPARGLLGLSLSYEMREDFAEFKFYETSLKLFIFIYIKWKEEIGHGGNHKCLWLQLLFVLNVLLSSGSTKIARHAAQRNNERDNNFQAFFRIESNSGWIPAARALTMLAFIALFQTLFCLILLMNSGPREIARVAIGKR